jgi:hypothetical protein
MRLLYFDFTVWGSELSLDVHRSHLPRQVRVPQAPNFGSRHAYGEARCPRAVLSQSMSVLTLYFGAILG